MSEPKFKHDCETCKFIGHFEGFDVYICPSRSPSIIARNGDEGSEYASTQLDMFQRSITENHNVGMPDGSMMKFQDYILSDHGSYHRAWLLALATLTPRFIRYNDF